MGATKRDFSRMSESVTHGEAKSNASPGLRSPSNSTPSPYMSMFETFRAELDEHHDRRERVIKASRDITAASKKIIFALQRVRQIAQPIPPSLQKTYKDHLTTIRERFTTAAPDLQASNAHRYARNISGGCQEFIEAASFEHYLVTGELLSYPDAVAQIQKLDNNNGPGVSLSLEDYLLGIYDMTGELMRFAITTMAIQGSLAVIGERPPQESHSEQTTVPATGKRTEVKRSVLTDMRELRTALEGIDAKSGPFARDVEKKAEVMRTSVEKVEKAFYSVVVRGAERPRGWIPDVSEPGSRTVEVES